MYTTTTLLRWCDDGPWASVWHRTHRGTSFAGFRELDDTTLDRLIDNGAELGTDGLWQAALGNEGTEARS